MSIRRFIAPLGLSALAGALLVGCASTPHSDIVREEARKRVNLMSAQLSHDQARQAFEGGKFDHAERLINSAIAMAPQMKNYYVLHGRIFLEQHLLEIALGSFEHAIEMDENYAEPHYYAGIVLERWSEDAKACEHYQRAFELEPTSVQYLLASAESLIAIDSYDEAKTLVNSKMKYFEYNAALHQILAQIALLEADPMTAAALFAEARLLDPDDKMLLEELAHAQYAAGLFAECYQSLQQLKVVLEKPRSDLTLLEARCLALMQRNKDARNLYIQLTREQSSNVEVWIELGSLAWELGDFRRTAQCSARAISLAPQRYEGYMLKGINEHHKGNLEKAASLLQKAASMSADEALPYLVFGQTLEELGELDQALAVYSMALRVEPDSREAQSLWSKLNTPTSLNGPLNEATVGATRRELEDGDSR